MHSTDLIIITVVYLLVLVPAVIAPLIWAAVLDGRYHSKYVRGRAERRLGRAKHAHQHRASASELHALRSTA